jgi:hypothetical protein
LALAITGGAGVASADGADARARAKEAYERGVEARGHGEPKKAAAEFARADAISPSTSALQAALDAAIEADDAALGAELLARSQREPPPPALASSITSAHIKFSGRAGRVRIVCPSGASCSAKIDEDPVEVDRVIWAQTGQRAVTVQVDRTTHTKVVEVTTEQLVEISIPRSNKSANAPSLVVALRPLPAEAETSASATEAKHDRHDAGRGLPRFVFYTGAGVTAVLAGSALYFGLDTGHQHRAFRNAGCATGDFTGCDDTKTRGQDSQTATNVSLVLLGLTAAATAVIGVAFTDWNGPIVSVSPSGLSTSWRTSF